MKVLKWLGIGLLTLFLFSIHWSVGIIFIGYLIWRNEQRKPKPDFVPREIEKHPSIPKPTRKAEELGSEYIDVPDDPSKYGLAAFVDTETTGLNNQEDEVVELSIFLFVFNRSTGQIMGISDEYTGLRDPQIPIPSRASKIHGITNKSVKGMLLDNPKVESMIEKAEFLIAHNAGFDRGFVERLFPISAKKKWYCSMNGIDWYGKGFSSKGLEKLITAHNISFKQEHRASDDVLAALLLLSQKDESGDYYFLELLNSKPSRRRKTAAR